MSISSIEKFVILIEDVALLTKIVMGKKANLVKFVWFVKCFLITTPMMHCGQARVENTI